MGLISRVSSRTYRFPKKRPLKKSNMVISVSNKMLKKGNAESSPIETQIGQAVLDIQNNAEASMKEQLMQLHMVGAKEFDVGGRNAIVISVPAPQVKSWNKVQEKLVRELEKKFSNKHVIIVGQRKIMAKEQKKSTAKCYKQKRPMTRTVKHVHEAVLEDIVFPSEIVGKRIRHKTDNKVLIKAFLNKASQGDTEHKTATFSAVYKRLTGKNVLFEFPEYDLDAELKSAKK